MGKTFTITLNTSDVGQLLDGLRNRAEAWRRTSEYMETGDSRGDAFLCEECTDSDEASQIADHYERTISSIEQQVALQRGR